MLTRYDNVMARSVYIETSVVSYYVALPSKDALVAGHQEATRRLWPLLRTEYEAFVSALVIAEASRGDPTYSARRLAAIRAFPVLDVDVASSRLAATLVGAHAIPEVHRADALHIAVAATNGIDVLVTWYFTHINNPFMRMRIRETVENAGYNCPEIGSPDELLGDDS
jgi:hypothetical protein